MRPWVLLGALALWLLFGFIGRATEAAWLDVLAGLALIVAIGAGVVMLVERYRKTPKPGPARGPMGDGRLFPPIGGGRWCDRCGTVTAKEGACEGCGHVPATRRSKGA